MRMWAENMCGIYKPLLVRCQRFFDKKGRDLGEEIKGMEFS